MKKGGLVSKMIPLYLVIILIFAGLILISLLSVVVYMLFFKSVSVVVFGVNGRPNQIIKGKKRKGRVWLKGGANFEIITNFVQQGKKRIYFAEQLDEKTFIPCSFVDSTNEIQKISVDYNNKKESESFNKLLKLNFDKKYKSLLNKKSAIETQISKTKEMIDENKIQLSIQDSERANKRKEKLITKLEKILKGHESRLKIVENKLSELRKLEEKKIEKLAKIDKQELKFYKKKKLNVDYNMLTGISDSYEESASRFKYGLEKFAPFITIAVVAIMCCIAVIMSMKYATEITPVEQEVFDELGENLNKATQYITQSQQVNNELLKQLDSNKQGEDIPE